MMKGRNQCNLGTCHCSQSLKRVWRWQYPGLLYRGTGCRSTCSETKVGMLRCPADSKQLGRPLASLPASSCSCHYSVHSTPDHRFSAIVPAFLAKSSSLFCSPSVSASASLPRRTSSSVLSDFLGFLNKQALVARSMSCPVGIISHISPLHLELFLLSGSSHETVHQAH